MARPLRLNCEGAWGLGSGVGAVFGARNWGNELGGTAAGGGSSQSDDGQCGDQQIPGAVELAKVLGQIGCAGDPGIAAEAFPVYPGQTQDLSNQRNPTMDPWHNRPRKSAGESDVVTLPDGPALFTSPLSLHEYRALTISVTVSSGTGCTCEIAAKTIKILQILVWDNHRPNWPVSGVYRDNDILSGSRPNQRPTD
jgi:hypothetical protein